MSRVSCFDNELPLTLVDAEVRGASEFPPLPVDLWAEAVYSDTAHVRLHTSHTSRSSTKTRKSLRHGFPILPSALAGHGRAGRALKHVRHCPGFKQRW